MVERILGKAEVGSSILPGGTSFPLKINPQPGALILVPTFSNVNICGILLPDVETLWGQGHGSFLIPHELSEI